jgi:hypothetical protein
MGEFDFASRLDLDKAYKQILLAESSRDCTTFTHPVTGRKYRMKRMFEGEEGAGNFFQLVMDAVLKGMESFARPYLDDVIVFTKGSAEDHARAVQEVVKRLTEVSLRLNPDKCKVGYKALVILGHLRGRNFTAADMFKVNVLKDIKEPTSGKQMHSVMGFANYLRDYIPMFSHITGPLEEMKLITKFKDTDWTSVRRKAWADLIAIVSNAPILSPPVWDEPFFVGPDSSQYGVGGALYQRIDGRIRFIAFASKALNKHQRNYPATKRELLALLFCLRKWSCFLYGRKFTIEVDHKALTYLNSSRNRMILDWLEFVNTYSFTVKYKKGFLHVLPDALSRIMANQDLDSRREDRSTPEIAAVQQVRGLNGWSREKMISELTGRRVPESAVERDSMVENLHQKSHQGEEAMFQILFNDERVFWPEMRRECRRAANSCASCLKWNVGKRGYHPSSPVLATLPMDHIAWDHAKMGVETSGGLKYMLVIVDIATRFVFLRPVVSKAAEITATALLGIFFEFGFPRVIQHDNDRSFNNKVIDEIKLKAKMEDREILPYHPSMNGTAEKYVDLAKNLVHKLGAGDDKRWADLAFPVAAALNARITRRHKSAPFALMFARKANYLFEGSKQLESTQASEEEKTQELLERGRELIEIVHPAIREAVESEQRDSLGSDKKAHILKIGTRVMVKVDERKDKGQQRYEGPMTVFAYDPNVKAYSLLDIDGKRRKNKVQREKLKVIRGSRAEGGSGQWVEIDKLLGHRESEEGFEYLVKWKGENEVEWVHEKLFSSEDIIRAYWKSGKVVLLQRELESAKDGNASAGDRSAGKSGVTASPDEPVVRFSARGRSISVPQRYRD